MELPSIHIACCGLLLKHCVTRDKWILSHFFLDALKEKESATRQTNEKHFSSQQLEARQISESWLLSSVRFSPNEEHVGLETVFQPNLMPQQKR